VCVTLNPPSPLAAPMDFASTTAQLTFTSSLIQLCNNITIEDDLIIEEEQEQFGVVPLTSDSAVQIRSETASVTLTDNDGTVCTLVK